MIRRAFAFSALAALTLLAACGGGEDGAPSVANISASSVAFSRATTITVSGRYLTSTSMTSEGEACEGLARTASTEDSSTYSCIVRRAGDLVFHVRRGDDANILGSLRIVIPKPQVTMTTTVGTIILELDANEAPKTAQRYLDYMNSTATATNRFYDNTLFHQVKRDLGVLGGAYLTNYVAKTPVVATVPIESNNGLKNLRGTIALLHGEDPNSGNNVFYINAKDNPQFDYVNDANPGYTVFGRIIQGIEVFDSIQTVPTQTRTTAPMLTDTPVTEVRITTLRQTK